MKTKENEAYVVNQPTHAILSIIFIGSDLYPLSKNIHDNLYNLSQISDLFFVFHKSGMSGINPDKFCNLYSACGWTYSSSSLVDTFLFVGQYDMNIFKNHSGYLVFNTIQSIPAISEEDKTKIQGINSSGTVDPILEMTRLTSDELYRIYSTPSDISSWITRPVNRNDRKYSIWSSPSRIIFFRPSLFSKFFTTTKEYNDSFSWDDIRYYIASAIKMLGLTNINSEILTVDFK